MRRAGRSGSDKRGCFCPDSWRLLAVHRAGGHPDVEPPEPAPRHRRNKEQRATVERHVRVKLGEPRIHGRTQVHRCGPGIMDIPASGNPDVEAWRTVRGGYSTVAVLVEAYCAAIRANRAK